MRGVLNFLFSTRLTAVLLFLFAYLIAWATFIENDFDTTTARIMIFRSTWLEIIMVLLVINFIGNIFKYKMISQRKWTVLLFHFAFIVIIAGAGVTRYFGFEGMMPVREGETSNVMFSSDPYFSFSVYDHSKEPTDPDYKRGYSQPKLMSEITDDANDFTVPFDFAGQEVEISYLDYYKNAEYKVYDNIKDGKDILELVTTGQNGRKSVYIESGESERIGNVLFAFNNPSAEGAVSIIERGDSFIVRSPYLIPKLIMSKLGTKPGVMPDPKDIPADALDTIYPNVVSKFETGQMHQVEGAQVVFKNRLKNAFKVLQSSERESERGDALKIKIKVGEEEAEQVLWGGPERIASKEYFKVGKLSFIAAYGAKPIYLPFSLRLDDFIVERYPGSSNPSGYKSDVTLLDEEKGLTENHSIFMNNVLDYGGYRFFQSGLDDDEKGTKLSVNYDAPGTLITYIGYLLLAIGFLLTLFNRKSRFYGLFKKVNDLRNKRMKLSVVLVLFSLMGFAQTNQSSPADAPHEDHSGHDHSQDHDHEHVNIDAKLPLGGEFKDQGPQIPIEVANKFGRVIVQSIEGRYEPVNTIAIDVLHKLIRTDVFKDSKGNVYSPEQFILEMIINGKKFDQERLIYVKDDSLRNFIGLKEGKFASILDFYDFENQMSPFKLKEAMLAANKKDPKKRNRWDKEVIKVGDKIETYFQTQQGKILRIFPGMIKGDESKWVSPADERSTLPLKQLLEGKGDYESLPTTASYASIYAAYITQIITKKYDEANSTLDLVNQLQVALSEPGVLPDVDKVEMEIDYNNAGIFNSVKKGYMYLSLFLLLFAFLDALITKRDSTLFKIAVKYPLMLFTALFAAIFVYHTYGLVVRWYLTEHAPWSNGYEALVFIAWGTALSGLVFSKFSKITLAGTAFVAFLIIMTAGHENMDPQLTQLVPVLKSYWLVIHVACITTSYGFFALGGILGLIVIGTLLFKTEKNRVKLNVLTQELTLINEMTVTIGIVLATVGTFLGGIWANESWGRYWGWDPKETWALIIVLAYAMLLHFRFIPGFIRGKFFFNAWGTIVGFGTVCMTFFGVNFYFSKSIHSYAAGDPPAFPIWLWVTIISILSLTIIAGIRDYRVDKKAELKN